jgi:uncharacterized protein YkwD
MKGVSRAVAVAFAGACLGALVLPSLAGADLVPSRSACPAAQNPSAPERAQEDAMQCLIRHVRERAGVRSLSSHRALERAAGRKTGDLMRCGFSHTACGNPPDAYARRYGYSSGTRSWSWGENLAWGRGKRGTARDVMGAWLRSPSHRSTLLRGSFEHFGLGLRRGRFSGSSHTGVWTLQLGCRGC